MSNKGILFGAGAYLMWGFFPIYFKALHNVPPLEIMFHRVVWCFVVMIFLISLKKEWAGLKAQIATPKVFLIYALAAGLLAGNWLIYIYGVNTEQVVETSLGYFITPMLSTSPHTEHCCIPSMSRYSI